MLYYSILHNVILYYNILRYVILYDVRSGCAMVHYIISARLTRRGLVKEPPGRQNLNPPNSNTNMYIYILYIYVYVYVYVYVYHIYIYICIYI